LKLVMLSFKEKGFLGNRNGNNRHFPDAIISNIDCYQ
jgi:hypothetical protein